MEGSEGAAWRVPRGLTELGLEPRSSQLLCPQDYVISVLIAVCPHCHLGDSLLGRRHVAHGPTKAFLALTSPHTRLLVTEVTA